MLYVKAQNNNKKSSAPLGLVVQGRLALARKMLVWIREVQRLEMFGVFGGGLGHAQPASALGKGWQGSVLPPRLPVLPLLGVSEPLTFQGSHRI